MRAKIHEDRKWWIRVYFPSRLLHGRNIGVAQQASHIGRYLSAYALMRWGLSIPAAPGVDDEWKVVVHYPRDGVMYNEVVGEGMKAKEIAWAIAEHSPRHHYWRGGVT